MRSTPPANRWISLLFGAVALACSSSDGGDGSRPTPFEGAPPAANAANGGALGASGSSSTGLQGTPERSPSGVPLGPGLGTPSNNGIGGAPPGSDAAVSVLVFSRTLGYRHDSIAPGIEAIRRLGTANDFAVTASEDPAEFDDVTLAGFDVVLFLSTSMDVLDEAQQGALQRYVRSGGGWVGVHAAADTEYGWAWYGQLIGASAWFKSHPEIQTATLAVQTADHASTAHLPPTFQLQDEWYNFLVNPRPSVTVLLTLDESSYSPGADAMGDHPIAWYHEFDGGRAWYTALGHRQELYQDPLFTQHLLGGIRWAAGVG